MSAWQYSHGNYVIAKKTDRCFKMIPNMNGFVYRSLRKNDRAMYFPSAPRNCRL